MFNKTISNKFGIPITVIANDQVKIEKDAVKQLLEFIEIQSILNNGKIEEIVITPDFHKGSKIPIGTVIKTSNLYLPQALGSDIGCGMSFLTLDIDYKEFQKIAKPLEKVLRGIFFEGKRNIPTNSTTRERILLSGISSIDDSFLEDHQDSLWGLFDFDKVGISFSYGLKQCDNLVVCKDYVGGSDIKYDSQLGSIGGGNHFVEIQRVGEVFDKDFAKKHGLYKDKVCVMIHSGSLTLGHASNNYIVEHLRNSWPKSVKHPPNKIYPLYPDDKNLDNYLSAINSSSNFATVNRVMLGLMVVKAIKQFMPDIDYYFLVNAMHNFIDEDFNKGVNYIVHRKGACDAFDDSLIPIPGSMGSSSHLVRGLGWKGNSRALESASHGAGRASSRGKSMKDRARLEEFLKEYRIITPVDPERVDIRGRSDIIKKYEDDILQEAPWAYKDIDPVIDSQVEFGNISKVCEMKPLLTIKS